MFYHPAAGYVVLVVSLLMTGLAWHFSLQYSAKRDLDRFSFQVEEIQAAIQERMTEYAHVLEAGVALFSASTDVSRAEWHTFISSLNIEENYPGTLGIGISVPIQPADLAAHIATVRKDGFPDYTVSPAGDRALYTSVIYLEPFDARNKRAFGYDMYSEAIRRAAMDRAIDLGQASISRTVTLLQEGDKDIQPGFLMYVPMYGGAISDSATAALRRESFTGFVYAVFRGNDLMHNILRPIGNDISLRIYDSSADGNRLLYQSGEQESDSNIESLSETRRLTVYGQKWDVVATRDYAESSMLESRQSTVIGISGLLIDFLLFYTIHLVGKQRRVLDREAYTRQLELANDELQRANNALALSNSALERSNTDLAHFAYSASHDLKSPLRAISNLAGFIQDDSADELSESSSKHLGLLQSRTVRLSKLLDDMMAYARIETTEAAKSNVDPAQLCQNVLALVEVPEGFEVTTRIEAPLVRVLAAPLQQVLMNLISNAIKHHDKAKGHIDISIGWSGEQLDIVVSDDGPGIPEEFKEQVFEMFRTLQSRDRTEGSGMGLAFVKKLIETNGGKIDVMPSLKWASGTSIKFTWRAELIAQLTESASTA